MMRLNINQLEKLDQQAQSRRFIAEDYQLLMMLLSSHWDLVNSLKDPENLARWHIPPFPKRHGNRERLQRINPRGPRRVNNAV